MYKRTDSYYFLGRRGGGGVQMTNVMGNGKNNECTNN